MELYVNPQITGFRQDVDGTIKELKIGSNKEDAYANIIEQGGKKLENNKTATINVSEYTEPVEVLPTSGKDGMKKVTVTLSNIPSGSGTLYCWRGDRNREDFVYLYSYSATPEVEDSLIVSVSETGSPSQVNTDDWTVNSITGSGMTVKNGDDVYTGYGSEPVVFSRYSTGDISLT